MRSILLAGAAALALGTAFTAPVQADPPQFNSLSAAAHAIGACVHLGLSAQTDQLQCAANVISDPGHGSNDWNRQYITQKQKKGDTHAYGTIQLQVGGNAVLKGDGNKQSVYQKQRVHAWKAGGLQLQLGGNLVVKGDGNHQSVTQKQSIHAVFTDDVPQVQVGLNVVVEGNHNYQSITQTQSTSGFYVGGSVQGQGALNIVDDGNHNTQVISQSQN